MKIPEEAAAGITLPEFTAEVDVEALEELAALAVEFGVLESEPDFDRLVQQQ
jgi:NitT/TauT family transport system substrate-binding protein